MLDAIGLRTKTIMANEHDFLIYLIVSRCITILDSICAARTLSMLPRLYLCLSLTLSVKLCANNTHMSGNGGKKRWEKRVRGNFVHYDFLKLHYIRHKIKDVSPLRVAALTCNSTLYTLPPKIAFNVPDNVSTMTCSYVFAC